MPAKKIEPVEEAAKSAAHLYELLLEIHGNGVFSEEFRRALKWQVEKLKWKHNELLK